MRKRWKTVAICLNHWMDEEPGRTPVRVIDEYEACYRCGFDSNIYVRREVEEQ